MNTLKVTLGFLAIWSFAVLAAPASPTTDWAGIWTGSIDTPGMGVDTITLVLKKADGIYTGAVEDSLGLVEKNTAISEVQVDGDEISFSFKAMGGSMDLMMRLSASGDSISAQLMNKAIGEWGAFESFSKK